MEMNQQGKVTVWAAMMVSNLMMLLALKSIPPGEVNVVLGKAMLGMGALMVPLALGLPRIVKGHQGWLASLAVCEGAAVLGIVSHVGAGLAQAWLLPVLGMVGTGLLYPGLAGEGR
jgi:hypothetical protein